jgi:hypothetical protein
MLIASTGGFDHTVNAADPLPIFIGFQGKS